VSIASTSDRPSDDDRRRTRAEYRGRPVERDPLSESQGYPETRDGPSSGLRSGS